MALEAQAYRRAHAPHRLVAFGLVLSLGLMALACEEEALPPAELQLLPSLSAPLWPAEPIEHVTVSTQTGEEAPKPWREFNEPVSEFSLKGAPQAQYQVRAYSSDGSLVRSGHSVTLDPAGLSAQAVPLMLGPAGQFASAAELAPTLSEPIGHGALIASRYLLSLGSNGVSSQENGSSARGWLYDFGWWRASPEFSLPCPDTNCRIESVLVVNSSIAVFVGEGGASFLDFTSGASGELSAPASGSFAEVSGGSIAYSSSGEVWLVGAGRADKGSDLVLQINSAGDLSWLRLSASRRGAALRYLPGRGLLVVGGNPNAAGAELLKPGAQAFELVRLAADASEGSAIIETSSGLVRFGGRSGENWAETVRLELGCAEPCTPTRLGPSFEGNIEQSALSSSDDFLVSAAAGSESPNIYRVAATESGLSWELLETRSGLKRAQLLSLPTGQVGLFGGTLADTSAPNTQLEVYFLR